MFCPEMKLCLEHELMPSFCSATEYHIQYAAQCIRRMFQIVGIMLVSYTERRWNGLIMLLFMKDDYLSLKRCLLVNFIFVDLFLLLTTRLWDAVPRLMIKFLEFLRRKENLN